MKENAFVVVQFSHLEVTAHSSFHFVRTDVQVLQIGEKSEDTSGEILQLECFMASHLSFFPLAFLIWYGHQTKINVLSVPSY